ncbi:MAG: AAA family ATPase [Candidatus Levybacteria bacterium]|nr:AAA family ATPase [Candidatus Levybacteria bacterium]
MAKKDIIAIVGMPGAGKSEAASYLDEKGIPFIRFGQLTDETVQEMGLPLTPQNERTAREKLRNELGMAAYAIKAKPKIKALLEKAKVVALDGLYSWEEYLLLKEEFPELILIHVYAEPTVRYARLAKRKIRPLTPGEARIRDVAELEKLNKGGPIAIADYMIENDTEDISQLHKQIDALFARLEIKI